jgi:putative RNA 2'-phosphotransferase
VEVDLGLEPVEPPALLFHGTATRFLDSIRQGGLIPGSRQHVHLSGDEATATTVGARHGRPAVLRVDAARMHAEGHRFYLSANGVWLTATIPPGYLTIPE